MPRLWHTGKPLLTADHAAHLRRGSAGGEDWAVPQGSSLFAPIAGKYRLWVAGDGSSVVSGIPTDKRLAGLTVRALHVRSAPGLSVGGMAHGRGEGVLTAYSGGARGTWGAGPSTGPHVHEDAYLHGVRIPMTQAVAWMTARLNQNEVDGTIETDEWRKAQGWLRAHGYAGPLDGRPGVYTYKALQKFLRAHGYWGPADGKPGRFTWRAFQRWLRRYGYTGVIDGIPGKYTWSAWQRFLNTL